jgi:nucleoside-diphosphate-sugar epimerase
MDVAVTGAAGFIGAAVCGALEAEGHRAIGIDLAATGPGERYRRADVSDRAALGAALDGATHVVHAAALVAEHGPMADFVRVNVGGTRNVLDAAEGAAVRRVVHVSSVAVWGYEFGRDVAEDDPPRPCGSPYVDTKGASELLARAHGATVVRPGDVYGPRSGPWVVRPVEAMRRGIFRLPRGGRGILTPVFVDDLVACLLRALVHPAAEGEAFTAHDGHPVTAAAFFAHHARWLGRRRVSSAPAPLVRLGGRALELEGRARGRPPLLGRDAGLFVSRRAAYPNARALERLGWKPRVPLAEGMRRTEAWARAERLVP